MAEGSDTGVFDQSTQEGVNRFLAAIGRTPNGMLTLDMQEFLLSSSAPAQGGSIEMSDYEDLAPGDSGDAVLALQRRLVELGYADGTPNGKYGPATISAVTFYQQCNGLEEDGLATAWLQTVLFSSRALTYDQTQRLSEGFGSQGAGETAVPAGEAGLAGQEAQPEQDRGNAGAGNRHAVLQSDPGFYRQRRHVAAEPTGGAGIPRNAQHPL